MINENFLWTEKYRPSKVSDCVLPVELKSVFQEYVNSGQIPNLMLSGSAGTGKTTVSKAMCEEIGCDYIVINGSTQNGIDDVRTTIKNYASSVSLSGGRKVIIIDEADYLTTNAQAGLRGSIEEFSNNASFIFTCNYKNKIIPAIHSRCTVIDFKMSGSKAKMATAFMKRVEYILDLESIKYDKKVVATVITKYFPDNRRVLNELQRYSVTGNIDVGILGSLADAQISDLVKYLDDKNLANCRKWVVQNLDSEPSRIFRVLYDGLYTELTPQTVPQMILILAKYSYQAAFVSDHEINFIACLIEILSDCEFKN